MKHNKPDFIKETPHPADAFFCKDIENLINDRHKPHLLAHETISIQICTGDNASWLQARIGDPKKAHVFDFFIRALDRSNMDEALGLLIDYMDAVLLEFFENERDAFFPLDFSERFFEEQTIFVRHEFRDFEAETLANALLGMMPKSHMS